MWQIGCPMNMVGVLMLGMNVKLIKTMAKKIVRTYYSTYIDTEVDDNDYLDESEMIEDVRLNMTDQITPEELYQNLCLECLEQEVLDVK